MKTLVQVGLGGTATAGMVIGSSKLFKWMMAKKLDVLVGIWLIFMLVIIWLIVMSGIVVM